MSSSKNCLRYILFILLLILSKNVFAQEKSGFPVRSSGPLKFDVDVCQFEGKKDSTRLELFFAVYLSRDTSVQVNKKSSTTLVFDSKIRNESGEIVCDFKEKKLIALYDSLNPSPNTTFLDLKTCSLFPEKVWLDIIIEDSLSGTRGQVSQSLQMRKFTNEFSLSDLYFISHVQRAKEPSIFAKQGILLVPHPSRSFNVNASGAKAFVFYELNHLSYDSKNQSFYDISTIIYDIRGNEMSSNHKELIEINSANTSRIEVLALSDLSSGIYRLLIQAVDRTSGMRREIGGPFQVVSGILGETDLLPMSAEEEEKYYNQIKYIATDLELDIFKKLNPKGKQEFLLRFWQSRDAEPTTSENEFMIEHFKRLSVVEQKFAGGINSDMGRVYIKYGPPYDIERDISRIGSSQAVEKWVYAIEGSVEFVFVDRMRDGRFVLVHSTHRDEYNNPGWKDHLR